TTFCYLFNPMKRRPSEPQPTLTNQPTPTSSHSVIPTTNEAAAVVDSRTVPHAVETTAKAKRHRRRRDSRSAFLALLRRYMNEAHGVQSSRTAPVNRATSGTATPTVQLPAAVPSPTAVPQKPAPLAPTVSMPGGSTNHKESVFIKLNNRIRSLEVNISLSSQYLSEMSRQYVSQMNEIRQQYEHTSKTANDTNHAAVDAKRELTARIDKLQTAIDKLDAKIASSIHPGPLDDIDVDDMEGTEVAPLLPAHLLDDGKRWTTEEVLVFVVIAQLITTTLVMLIARCCRRKVVVMDAETVRKLVDEQLLARNAQLNVPVLERCATPPVADRFVFGDIADGKIFRYSSLYIRRFSFCDSHVSLISF
uniref:Uncharacterized protein n=1 Tax=Plectus sambesii TaxID=2011161 RepID=A0A914V7I1_9BILA